MLREIALNAKNGTTATHRAQKNSPVVHPSTGRSKSADEVVPIKRFHKVAKLKLQRVEQN